MTEYCIQRKYFGRNLTEICIDDELPPFLNDLLIILATGLISLYIYILPSLTQIVTERLHFSEQVDDELVNEAIVFIEKGTKGIVWYLC